MPRKSDVDACDRYASNKKKKPAGGLHMYSVWVSLPTLGLSCVVSRCHHPSPPACRRALRLSFAAFARSRQDEGNNKAGPHTRLHAPESVLKAAGVRHAREPGWRSVSSRHELPGRRFCRQQQTRARERERHSQCHRTARHPRPGVSPRRCRPRPSRQRKDRKGRWCGQRTRRRAGF